MMSLRDSAPQFAVSLRATRFEEQLEADRCIEASSPVLSMASGGIANYLDKYPDDPALLYWHGLTCLRRGEAGLAVARFHRAAQLGFDSDRLDLCVARAASSLHEPALAEAALQRLEKRRPELEPRTLLSMFAQAAQVEDGGEDRQGPAWLWRQRLEAFMALGELERAAELAHQQEPEGPTRQGQALLYRFGLACHGADRRNDARWTYGQVAELRGLDPDLAAWAYFKLGELNLEQGEEALARECFSEAVALKPDHAKARIMLLHADEPLLVSVGESSPLDRHIALSMALRDEALWGYYFSRRRPAAVRAALDLGWGRAETAELIAIAARWLAPGGELVLLWPEGEAVPAALSEELALHQADPCLRLCLTQAPTPRAEPGASAAAQDGE